MAKKNTDKKKEPDFEGLGIIGNTPTPTIEKSTKKTEAKTSTSKVGRKRLNPKDWVKIWIKLDPEIRKKLKGKAGEDDDLTPSIIVNNALKKYLK